MARAADQDITDTLFADMGVDSNVLTSHKEYLNFGKKCAGVLYAGKAPYKLPVFF
jgi:hypothetical protein